MLPPNTKIDFLIVYNAMLSPAAKQDRGLQGKFGSPPYLILKLTPCMHLR